MWAHVGVPGVLRPGRLLGRRVRVWLSRVLDAWVGPGEAAGPCRDVHDWEVHVAKAAPVSG